MSDSRKYASCGMTGQNLEKLQKMERLRNRLVSDYLTLPSAVALLGGNKATLRATIFLWTSDYCYIRGKRHIR